jgi:DNA-binding HxlR family transcriptional regulator
MPGKSIAGLDPVIHAKVRLAVMSILVSVKEASFTYLKNTIGTSDGNLSVSLSKLEEAGYVTIKKSYAGKKPLTTISVSKKGKAAFSRYVKALESLLHFNERENEKKTSKKGNHDEKKH